MKREEPLNALLTQERAGPRLQVPALAWLLPAAVLFLPALVPTTLQAQLLLCGVLPATLVPCHYLGRHARALRAQSLWRLTVIAVCTLLSKLAQVFRGPLLRTSLARYRRRNLPARRHDDKA